MEMHLSRWEVLKRCRGADVQWCTGRDVLRCRGGAEEVKTGAWSLCTRKEWLRHLTIEEVNKRRRGAMILLQIQVQRCR
jgi:hypothetical protein